MADEIASFRKLAAKVYETMTQDVNDVLTNEHATLMEYYKEKIEYYTNKMTRCIDEIFDICPNFDFDQYYSPQREEYLRSKFPVPEEVSTNPFFQFKSFQRFFPSTILIQKSWKC